MKKQFVFKNIKPTFIKIMLSTSTLFSLALVFILMIVSCNKKETTPTSMAITGITVTHFSQYQWVIDPLGFTIPKAWDLPTGRPDVYPRIIDQNGDVIINEHVHYAKNMACDETHFWAISPEVEIDPFSQLTFEIKDEDDPGTDPVIGQCAFTPYIIDQDSRPQTVNYESGDLEFIISYTYYD